MNLFLLIFSALLFAATFHLLLRVRKLNTRTQENIKRGEQILLKVNRSHDEAQKLFEEAKRISNETEAMIGNANCKK